VVEDAAAPESAQAFEAADVIVGWPLKPEMAMHAGKVKLIQAAGASVDEVYLAHVGPKTSGSTGRFRRVRSRAPTRPAGDENPAAVAAYMRDNKYTLPVINDAALADRLFPYVGLPSNFLVSAGGLRTTFYGFTGGEAGFKRMINDLETAAK
jgi:hypothetical protein